MNILKSSHLASNHRADRMAFSITELSQALGLSEAFIRREIRRGRLHGKHAGRRILISTAAIDAYLEEN